MPRSCSSSTKTVWVARQAHPRSSSSSDDSDGGATLVPPAGAALFETETGSFEPAGPLIAFVAPGGEVEAGRELVATVTTDQCVAPVWSMGGTEFSYMNWFAEDAARGDVVRVAVPEDFLPGAYQISFWCVPEIASVGAVDITVVAAVNDPVEVTDQNRPANYCHRISDRLATGCLDQTPVPSEDM